MKVRMRGIVFAAVAAAVASSAFAQYSAEYYLPNGLSRDFTDISVLQTDGTSSAISSGFTAYSGQTTQVNITGSNGLFQSILIGTVNGIEGDSPGDHIVIYMKSSVANAIISGGISWSQLFSVSESLLATNLRGASLGDNDAKTFVSNFASNSLTSIGSFGSGWFSTTDSYSGVKFSVGTDVVPEPFTMAFAAIAPLVYLRRKRTQKAS